MARYLFVTIANKKFINQAKQLFASAYFNAGWDGDYMLLTSDLGPEQILWFEKRGILVKKHELLFQGKMAEFDPVVYHKFYLFTDEFKKWDAVIYADSDIIIRNSLEGLKNTANFSAVVDTGGKSILKQLTPLNEVTDKPVKQEYLQKLKLLKRKYNLRKPSFNAGFFALNTKMIKGADIKNNLIDLALNCKNITNWGEQLAFNLEFFNWEKLSPVYNFFVYDYKKNLTIKKQGIKSPVLHFAGQETLKPWDKKSPFYSEWKENLERSEKMDVREKMNHKKQKATKFHSAYICIVYRIKKTLCSIDVFLGAAGDALKKKSPELYIFIKKFKK